MKKFFASLVVGLPVTFLVMIIFFGSVNDAGLFVLMSIVCTAGIGLVGWIPLWWFVGWTTLSLIGLLMKKPNGKEKEEGKKEGKEVGATRESLLLKQAREAMTQYIRQAEARGMSPAEVTLVCQQQGYSDEEIQKARQRALNS